MVRYKDEAGRKIKAANFITDDLSLLAAAAMKKFKHFFLSSPHTSKPSAKNPTFFFFFLLLMATQHQACHISDMMYSLTS